MRADRRYSLARAILAPQRSVHEIYFAAMPSGQKGRDPCAIITHPLRSATEHPLLGERKPSEYFPSLSLALARELSLNRAIHLRTQPPPVCESLYEAKRA